MTLDEIFDHGKEAAKHLFDAQGNLTPMWLMETAGGELIPALVPFGSPEEKEAAIEVLKKLMREKKVVRYVSMAEAWVYVSKPGDKVGDILAAGPIREHPERKEIVHVSAEDKYHSRFGYFHVARSDDGEPHLADFEALPADSRNEGLFTNLLESGEAVN